MYPANSCWLVVSRRCAAEKLCTSLVRPSMAWLTRQPLSPLGSSTASQTLELVVSVVQRMAASSVPSPSQSPKAKGERKSPLAGYFRVALPPR